MESRRIHNLFLNSKSSWFYINLVSIYLISTLLFSYCLFISHFKVNAMERSTLFIGYTIFDTEKNLVIMDRKNNIIFLQQFIPISYETLGYRRKWYKMKNNRLRLDSQILCNQSIDHCKNGRAIRLLCSHMYPAWMLSLHSTVPVIKKISNKITITSGAQCSCFILFLGYAKMILYVRL